MGSDNAEETAGLLETCVEANLIKKKIADLLPRFPPAAADSTWRYYFLSLGTATQKKRAPSPHTSPTRIPQHRFLLLLLLAIGVSYFLWSLIQNFNKSLQKQHPTIEDGISSSDNDFTVKGELAISPNNIAPPTPFNRWMLEESNQQHTLDCARVLNNDTGYIAAMAAQRIQFADPDHLDMDCAGGIRWRNFFPEQEDPDDYWPLAQARIVYRDYVFLEMELASAYSPNNWYCYAVDAKADETFLQRIDQLASCLPNVFVLPERWDFDGAGHNISRAHLACLRALAVPDRPWRYVALLQNHDTAIKTNREMKEIYKLMDGANDVEVTHLPGGRVNDTLDWSFEAIRMFRNESRNLDVSPNGFPPQLVFSKGYVQSSLTREMTEFMLKELDLTDTLGRIEAGGFGIDEILIPTLHAADALQAPGGFTHACLEQDKRVQHITRSSIWYDDKLCGSHHMRHAICVFGLEDLPLHLSVWPHLFANKFQPDFDFGAIVCWYEAMHNRSHQNSQESMLLDRQFYADLPNVRFQKFKRNLAKLNGIMDTDDERIAYKDALRWFNCSEKFKNDNR